MKFEQSNNAAMVIPMFGESRWPYIDLWLATVASQPMDVIFLTNLDLGHVPDNVKVIHSTVDEVFDWAESCFGIRFACRFPYKLCDLKAFYGAIFKEELRPYDFWGYGDCDVCYGKLPAFQDYDLYAGCLERDDMDMVKSETPLGRWFMPGHFVMMRNSPESRDIMGYLPTGLELLADGVNRYIDEHLVPTVLLKIFGQSGRYHIVSNDLQYMEGRPIRVDGGVLTLGGEVAHYIHFYTAKGRMVTPHWEKIPDSFDVRGYIHD